MKYNNTEHDAMLYLEAHLILEELRRCQRQLDRQQIKTLRGQALSGDVEGARKGLDRLMQRCV